MIFLSNRIFKAYMTAPYTFYISKNSAELLRYVNGEVGKIITGTILPFLDVTLVTVQRFMSPGDMGFTIAAMALLAAIIGGVGSLPGAMVGAALVILVRDYIGQRLGGAGPMLVGAMFVIAVYLLPSGLAGLRAMFKRRERAS